MENDTDLKQPDHPKQDALHDEAADQPISPRPLRKTVLIAAVIGIGTIGVLSVLLPGQAIVPGSNDHQEDITTPTGLMPENSTEPFTPETFQADQAHEALQLKLNACVNRVDQGFDALKADHLIIIKELPAMGEGIRVIRDAIADLRLGNEVLSQRITEAQAKLKTIAKDVRALKTSKKKSATKKRKTVVTTPPFQIDAIDLWDDVTYVAISHNGRAAFLKEGEQQSGWVVARIDQLKGEVGFRGPAGQIHSAIVQR